MRRAGTAGRGFEAPVVADRRRSSSVPPELGNIESNSSSGPASYATTKRLTAQNAQCPAQGSLRVRHPDNDPYRRVRCRPHHRPLGESAAERDRVVTPLPGVPQYRPRAHGPTIERRRRRGIQRAGSTLGHRSSRRGIRRRRTRTRCAASCDRRAGSETERAGGPRDHRPRGSDGTHRRAQPRRAAGIAARNVRVGRCQPDDHTYCPVYAGSVSGRPLTGARYACGGSRPIGFLTRDSRETIPWTAAAIALGSRLISRVACAQVLRVKPRSYPAASPARPSGKSLRTGRSRYAGIDQYCSLVHHPHVAQKYVGPRKHMYAFGTGLELSGERRGKRQESMSRWRSAPRGCDRGRTVRRRQHRRLVLCGHTPMSASWR